MKFVKRFKTETDYNSYMGGDRLILPNISLIDEASEMSEEDSGVRFNPLPPYDPYNGHEYVDLGLPSGLKWAKCNIGAEKESDYGLYFAWGETVGYKDASSGKSFSWGEYKYCNGTYNSLTKYCTPSSSLGTVDNLTTLEPSDDAASVNMGGSWRMPTESEFNELLNYTTKTWTTVEGVSGKLFTSRYNGNTLFFPASGYCYGGDVYKVGSHGLYWSPSLYTSYPSESWYLYLYPDSSYGHYMEHYLRCHGRPVRGVVD